MSGNRCGHDPDRPDLTGLHRHPMPFLATAMERAAAMYWHPGRFPELREMKSERSEAAVRASIAFLAHAEIVTLRVLRPPTGNGDHGVRRRQLRRLAKLSRQRFDRVNLDLIAAGYLVRDGQPREEYAPGRWRGYAARWRLTPLFFRRLGLAVLLDHVRKRFYKRRRREVLAAMRPAARRAVAKGAPPTDPTAELTLDQRRRYIAACIAARAEHADWTSDQQRAHALAVALGKPPPP